MPNEGTSDASPQMASACRPAARWALRPARVVDVTEARRHPDRGRCEQRPGQDGGLADVPRRGGPPSRPAATAQRPPAGITLRAPGIRWRDLPFRLLALIIDS